MSKSVQSLEFKLVRSYQRIKINIFFYFLHFDSLENAQKLLSLEKYIYITFSKLRIVKPKLSKTFLCKGINILKYRTDS